MASDVSFRTALKRRRKALDLTQEELAWRTGCAVETLRKLEQGKRRPSRDLAQRLADELKLPEAERVAFVQHARLGGSESAPSQANPLPAPLTPLVERAKELAALRALLGEEAVRLLTVVGAPGIGKTRLCLQAASEAAGRFADGAHFVALAPIADPALVVSAVAQALGVKERPGQPLLESLKDYLREKTLLVILDNFEHLLLAAPLVADLLSAAPGLKVMVSSRTPLHLYGEHEYEAPPLSFPDPEKPPLEALADYGAVELFVSRARAVQEGFGVTPENASAIAEICRRLDGLPLALELAATRVKLFSPQALLARLDKPLSLLTGGPSDLPERQRTLRSTIAWSYDLLDEELRALFRRLGVFVGGFTLAAAEAVAAADETAEGVAALLDKNLVQRLPDMGEEPRFGMLETIREYALERLSQAPAEHAETRALHGAYHLEALERTLESQTRAALEASEQELGNLRSAWQWAVSNSEAAWLLRAAEPFRTFLGMRGRLREGLEVFAKAVQGMRASAAPEVWGSLLVQQAWFASRLGRIAEAQALAEAGLAALEPTEDHPNALRGLTVLGYAAKFRGDYQQAEGILQRALELAEFQQDRAIRAACLADLANVQQLLGNYPEAMRRAEAAQALYREMNDQGGMVWSLAYLGLINTRIGDLAAAQTLLTDALDLAQGSGEHFSFALVLSQLGLLNHARQAYPEARRWLQRALETARQTGEAGLEAWLLSDLGRVELDLERPDEARRCFQQALELAWALRWPAPMLSALAGLAHATAALGNSSRAREMAALVHRHPATERVHRELAERLLAGREPPALEDLEPQGLEETVRALLREAG